MGATISQSFVKIGSKTTWSNPFIKVHDWHVLALNMEERESITYNYYNVLRCCILHDLMSQQKGSELLYVLHIMQFTHHTPFINKCLYQVNLTKELQNRQQSTKQGKQAALSRSITSVIPYDPVGKTNKKNISNVIQHANDSNCIMNGNKSIIIIFLRKFEPQSYKAICHFFFFLQNHRNPVANNRIAKCQQQFFIFHSIAHSFARQEEKFYGRKSKGIFIKNSEHVMNIYEGQILQTTNFVGALQVHFL